MSGWTPVRRLTVAATRKTASLGEDDDVAADEHPVAVHPRLEQAGPAELLALPDGERLQAGAAGDVGEQGTGRGAGRRILQQADVAEEESARAGLAGGDVDARRRRPPRRRRRTAAPAAAPGRPAARRSAATSRTGAIRVRDAGRDDLRRPLPDGRRRPPGRPRRGPAPASYSEPVSIGPWRIEARACVPSSFTSIGCRPAWVCCT